MFFKKSKRKTTKSVRRKSQTRKNPRVLELAIAAILVLVLIYGASFAIRITHGFSKTIDMPEHVIRLQILNGCGINGIASRAAKILQTKVKHPLEVEIIEVGDFDSYNAGESFIISRKKDLKPARLFAEQIGINSEKIVYKSIENNYRSITVTLVLGDDCELLLETSTE
jgi:LytR cell envelope-related transcriptional attenuator